MAFGRGLHHFPMLSYLNFKKGSNLKISKKILKFKFKAGDSIFFSKCSPLFAEYNHVITNAPSFLGFPEKSILVDQWVQKPWFPRKPTSEHFGQKCPLDKRKSVV
jgi:hypothetical protein